MFKLFLDIQWVFLYYTYWYYYLINAGDLRANLNTLEFMCVVMSMLHSPHVQYCSAVYQTFLTFAAYGAVNFVIIISELMIKNR